MFGFLSNVMQLKIDYFWSHQESLTAEVDVMELVVDDKWDMLEMDNATGKWCM